MTNSRTNSVGNSNDPLANLDLDGWTMHTNDQLNWTNDFDFTYANTVEQNNDITRGRLFSIPSDPEEPTQPASHKETTVAEDLPWLDDLVPAPIADNGPATNNEPSTLYSLPDISNVYPEPNGRSSSNPYFTAPQQNALASPYGCDQMNFANANSAEFQVAQSAYYNLPATLEPYTGFTFPASGATVPFSNDAFSNPRPMSGSRKKSSSQASGEARPQSSNSTNSDEYTAALPTRTFRKEKPKYDPDHPWHRINATTMGLTKRSGKINQYKAKEMYKQGLQNPFDAWRSPNYKFDYYEHGELAKLEYSADEIKEFIYHHPSSQDSKLLLWIQKTPADSGKRYHTPTLAKCRLSECPSRQAGLNGTIWSGHMRVALDERSAKYKEKADPFSMAGFFHLYCFEKFLNLPHICTLPNVEVLADMRQLANEPNMKWAASLTTAKEGIVAQRFIESCRKGRSRIRDFENYPRPHNVEPGAPWPYELTLSYRMQVVKEGDRARSSKESLNKRPQRATQINVNLGDMDVACRAKVGMRKAQPMPQARRKRNRKRRASSWISEVDSEYVSVDEDDDRLAGRSQRKRRRNNSISDVLSAARQVINPAVNQSAPMMLQNEQYAWPQYNSGTTATADTIIATSNFETALFVNPTLSSGGQQQQQPALDYPSDVFAAPSVPSASSPFQPVPPANTSSSSPFRPAPPAPALREIAVPSSYPLGPSFNLSAPTKRIREEVDADPEESSAKRTRRAEEVQISPKCRAVSTATANSVPTPRRRSSRLSSNEGSSNGAVEAGRRRSSRLIGRSNVIGSMGSLFGE